MANATVPESHADLLEAPIATLATVGRDGRPQTSTVWFLAETAGSFSPHTDRQKTRTGRRTGVACNPDQANPAPLPEMRGDARIESDQN